MQGFGLLKIGIGRAEASRLIQLSRSSEESTNMIRIQSVEPLRDFLVRLTFSDNSEKVVDLEPYLHGPVFEAIRTDRRLFRSVRVDPELGTIVWPNGADVDPDVLYKGLLPEWVGMSSPDHKVS